MTARTLRIALLALLVAGEAHAEFLVAGRLDLRAVAADDGPAWIDGGPAKLRFASGGDVHLAQGVLSLGWRSDEHPFDATVVLNATDDRSGVVDATEASLRWRPVPDSPWRSSVRVGAFFPDVTLESSGLGWTPGRGLSTSAGNAWIGDELRTIGIEASWNRQGRFVGSAHDFQVAAALFTGNDTAGALLAWRGWTVGDRLSGLRERIPLPDLPTFEPEGAIAQQVPWTNPFRELDGRPGAYVVLGHAHADGWESRVWIYDNFADTSVVRSSQYAWHTRFVHAWTQRRWENGWALAAQAISGSTRMGPKAQLAVDNRFCAASLHLSRTWSGYDGGLRAEWFDVTDHDATPDDPNDETGRSLTLHASKDLGTPGWTVVAEASWVDSERPARALVGFSPDRIETSLSLALRRDF